MRHHDGAFLILTHLFTPVPQTGKRLPSFYQIHALTTPTDFMADDILARIAVLGAGPIGLETALYARYLGHEVDVYERGHVAENVLQWGHVRMFSPPALNRSSLGKSALQAQEPGYKAPGDEALQTGLEWAETYLIPLSRTDLIADCIHQQTKVVSVGRDEVLKGELAGDDRRGNTSFRLLLHPQDGPERIATADIVIDSTGTYPNHHWLGKGGIPAVGEVAVEDRIEYCLPDILGSDRRLYAGKHTLLIGAGYSAATCVVSLAELARSVTDTQVTWVTRSSPYGDRYVPIRRFENDRLPERDQLAAQANHLAQLDQPITYRPDTHVCAISQNGDRGAFAVILDGPHDGLLTCDGIIANVGYRPDDVMTRELQVHACYASEGPMKLAAALQSQSSADCLDTPTGGPQSLRCPEPDFYVLGSKSYGRNSTFLFSQGLSQIRDLFQIIGGRVELDLYATLQP